MDEKIMQAILMEYTMEQKKHQMAIPNIRKMWFWEADLISVTKTWFVHEFEIEEG